jgi:hypothetical protein
MSTSLPTSLSSTSDTPFFLLQFLEVGQPVANQPTGGAETETETGDGSVPPKKDMEEDEDETGTDDDED